MTCFICSRNPTSGILLHARFYMADGSWSEEMVCPLCMIGAAVEEAESVEETSVEMINRGKKALGFK